MQFWLGTHMTEWLKRSPDRLFISAIQLRKRPVREHAVCPWALDSGGFTELSTHGRWTVTPEQYVSEIAEWSEVIGPPEWAAIQDWMCEPWIIQKTGLTIEEHQRRTIDSWERLRFDPIGSRTKFVPVLQGWEYGDYINHAEMYYKHGTDLSRMPLVGLGSICRRQSTRLAEVLIRDLKQKYCINVHGFGFKIEGLKRCSRWLASADSLSWSYTARRASGPMIPGHKHAKCANCYQWAMQWRRRLADCILYGETRPQQGELF